MATAETTQEKPSQSPAPDISDTAKQIDAVQDTLSKFLDTASVDRVYGEPIRQGDTTIIPAAEVLVGLGFGVGSGSGPAKEEENAKRHTGGGGGGGGGRTLSRPAAIIVASPHGVRVEPVVDTTKIAMAAITAGGFMMATWLGFLNPKQAIRQLKGE